MNCCSPIVPPPVSVQEPILGPLSAAQRHLQDWVPGCFESPQNLALCAEPPSMPLRLLSVSVMAGDLMKTTTITSTVATPAESTRPVYPPYSSQALSLGSASARPVQVAAGSQPLTTRIDPVEICLEVWTSPYCRCAEFGRLQLWGCLGQLCWRWRMFQVSHLQWPQGRV